MKTRWLLNCIAYLAYALLLTGCAAAATTANVVQVEPPSPASAEPLTPMGAAPADVVDAFAVLSPPPDAFLFAGPSAALETEEPAPTAEASPEPSETPAAEPSPSSKETAEPSPTPAYVVDELDEYVEGYVNAKTINLRKGPGTDYDVLGEYARYDELLVTGTCEEWCRVKLDGLRGYMLMEYVTIGSVPAPTPSATPKASATPTPSPTPSASISITDELYLAAQVVYKEGDGESYVAVANVIYNRVQSSSFPDTIYDVVYQKNQFSTSSLKTPSSAALAAVQQIFVNKNLILPSEVLYFQSTSRGTSRDGYNYYGSFGGNAFFYK